MGCPSVYGCPSCGSINTAEPNNVPTETLSGRTVMWPCGDPWHGEIGHRPPPPEPQEIPVPDISPQLNPTPGITLVAQRVDLGRGDPVAYVALCGVYECRWMVYAGANDRLSTTMDAEDQQAARASVTRQLDEHTAEHRTEYAVRELARAMHARQPNDWTTPPLDLARQLLTDMASSNLLLASSDTPTASGDPTC